MLLSICSGPHRHGLQWGAVLHRGMGGYILSSVSLCDFIVVQIPQDALEELRQLSTPPSRIQSSHRLRCHGVACNRMCT